MVRRICCMLIAALCTLAGVLPAFAEGGEAVEHLWFTDGYLYLAVKDELQGVWLEAVDAAQRLDFAEGAAESVSRLDLSNAYITDLGGLEAFTGLTDLNIANNSISDFSPLAGLTNLRRLNALGNRAQDVECLASLTELTELDLSKNKLYDSEAKHHTQDLAGLTKLQRLSLSGNLLLHADGLENLTELTFLDLYDNAIHDFSPLGALTKLRELYLGQNNEKQAAALQGLDALENLQDLRVLEFSQNYTPSVTQAAGKLPLLEELYIDYNRAADLAPLAALSNLRVLECSYNQVADITPILGLTKLEVMDLYYNTLLKSLAGIVSDNKPVWPNLKRLDVSDNWRLGPCEEIDVLFALSRETDLEFSFDYERTRDVSDLPHVDEDGTAYVSYDDFAPYCDGVRDDWNAIACAHRFANACGCEVRANPEKTYHVFKRWRVQSLVQTNVDWQGATFVIHDEDIERFPGKHTNLFAVETPAMQDALTLTDPAWTIAERQTVIPELKDLLEPYAELGCETFYCSAFDDDTRQYIRYGSDADSGLPMQDYFRVDAEGRLLNDIQWDFAKITRFVVRPIPAETQFVRGGNFITTAFDSRSEVPYTRGSKAIYYNRGIIFQRCANLEVSDITHTVEPDVLSGSYIGFLVFSDSADVSLHDCSLFARKTNVVAHSTYDLLIQQVTDMEICRVTSNDITDLRRWGVTGTNYTKDIVYDHCYLNRIDAHRGVYNLTIRDCETGQYSLTGKGTLNVLRSTVWRGQMILLRGDYGSTWDGRVNLIDCTAKYWGQWAPVLLSFSIAFDEDGTLHDFGYPLRMPDVYVENLTIDCEYDAPAHTAYTLIPNWDSLQPEKAPAEYWPASVVLNGYRYVNNEHMGRQRVQITGGNQGEISGNFVITDLKACKGSLLGEDLTRALIEGEKAFSDEPVALRIAENGSTVNEVEVTRDGAPYLERCKVTDTWLKRFDRSGSYEVTLYSIDPYRHKDGRLTLRFDIDLSKEGELAEGVSYMADALPEGLALSVSKAEGAPACTVLAAVYDADGRFLGLQYVETGEFVLPLEGDASSVMLFCVDEELAPLGEGGTPYFLSK